VMDTAHGAINIYSSVGRVHHARQLTSSFRGGGALRRVRHYTAVKWEKPTS